jgi:uncharacterized protein YndB with AHSA1/START domain
MPLWQYSCMSILELPDGRYVMRIERVLPHPPEKVWRGLTEVEHLRVWFVEIVDYDRSALTFTEGAELSFVPRTDAAIGQGRVTRADPPRLLEYTWDEEVLRWELEPVDGGCRLVFTNILGDRGTAEAVESGWHTGLDRLAARLDSVHAVG